MDETCAFHQSSSPSWIYMLSLLKDNAFSIDPITSATESEKLVTSSSGALMLYAKKLSFITLDWDNYVSWRAQVMVVLRGADLLHFVEGDVDLTASSILVEQDKIILGWIFAALFPSILAQVSNLTTLTEAWKALSNLFSLNSTTCIIFLQWQFLFMKKEQWLWHLT